MIMYAPVTDSKHLLCSVVVLAAGHYLLVLTSFWGVLGLLA